MGTSAFHAWSLPLLEIYKTYKASLPNKWWAFSSDQYYSASVVLKRTSHSCPLDQKLKFQLTFLIQNLLIHAFPHKNDWPVTRSCNSDLNDYFLYLLIFIPSRSKYSISGLLWKVSRTNSKLREIHRNFRCKQVFKYFLTVL